MDSLFEDQIRHLPKATISKEDSYYLGYVDGCDVRLVVEEWEFRIYNYERWSYDSIREWDHEDESWWGDCCIYFSGASDCLDEDTVEYSVPKFDSYIPKEMAIEIAEKCSEELEDIAFVRETDSPYEDRLIPKKELVEFICNALEKVDEYKHNFVFYYYK